MDFSRYEKLRTLVRANFSEQTQALVDEALVYADGKLASLTRYDGSPLLTHAAAVAGIVISEVGLGRNSTISAILHDVVRLAHKQLPAEEFLALTADIRSRFGEQVVGITIGMCNISELKLKVAKEQAENFRDLLVSYSEDPRVILIKLADRLEVMRSLEIFPHEKWRKKSWESMNLYAQIAHKLGLYSLKSELEDIALKYLEPKDYEHIVTKLEESADERKAFIARFLVPIEERLHKLGIKYHIKSRTKSIFSIWTKMHKQHVPFEGVYDIFALRIILDCPPEEEKTQCWAVYSIVTDYYIPNTERLRDWISIPKSNGYESLHTTVSAGGGRWVEIQIRTERMDAVAERGIAAHWRYKGVNQGALTSEMWLGRLRELMENTPHALAQRFDSRPSSGEIFVFTPNGDLRKLPEGATVLDFAFDIHSNLGCSCSGGKINGRAVPIKETLHNGDIVEILTQKNQTPKADWLSAIKTAKARSRIQQYLRTEERAAAMGLGREMLEKEARKAGINLSKAEKDGHLSTLVNSLAAGSVDELMASIGYARFTTKQVVKRLQAIVSPPEILETPDAVDTVVSHRKRKEQSPPPPPKTGGISVRGVDDMMVRIAHCCNPVPGDSIVGFISRGRGVIVHTATCPNIQEMEPDRLVSVQWDGHETQPFPVRIHIMARNQKGSLADIAIVLRDEDVNIDGCLLQALVDGRSEMEMVVQVRDVAHLYHVIDRLRHLPSVMEVLRKTANEE